MRGVLALTSFTGCVDDYSDANGPRPLDSPFFILSTDRDEIFSHETATLNLAVIDAPGKVEALDFNVSDGFGTVTLDQASFDAAKGQEKGTITATFNPPANEGTATITVTLSDAQGEQQKSHVASVELDVHFSCVGQDLSGNYDAVNCDDDAAKATINAAGADFSLSDLTAGLYGMDIPVTLTCSNGVLTAAGVTVDTLEFTDISGEIEPDGSIILDWTVDSPNTDPSDCSTEFTLE